MTVARREHKAFQMLEFKADMSARTFNGYAATWTEDSYGDRIQPGAFQKTIGERGPISMGDGSMRSKIKILWQHDQKMPIGLPTVLAEDSKGLYVEGKVIGTECGDMAMTCLAAGVVDQLSIGYTVVQASTRYDEDDGSYEGRDITELKLYEFSPVTFPANEGATIDQVKGLDALLKDALPMLTKENAGIVLREIEKAGDAPAWLKVFLRALTAPPEPRPPAGGTTAASEPPASKDDPQHALGQKMLGESMNELQSLLKSSAEFNARVAEMLARRTGG